MKSRDDRHAQFAQQCEDVTARPSTEDTVFELEAGKVHVVDVQEVRSPAVGIDIFLRQLEPNTLGVIITRLNVVHGEGNERPVAVFRGHGLTEIRREGGDAALARKVVADERNAIDD